MGTLLKVPPYRIFLPSNDHSFPIHIHIHVDHAECVSKWNLDPVELVESYDCKDADLNKIRKMLRINLDRILERWHDEWNFRERQ